MPPVLQTEAQVCAMRVTSGEKPNTRRSGRLARAIALFFVVYTGADILMPQYFCAGEEGGNLSLQASVLLPGVGAGDEPVLAAFAAPGDSHRERQQDQEPHGEDCFCCCAHVLPGVSFGVADTAGLRSLPAPPALDFIPTPPPHGTYRPPRFV